MEKSSHRSSASSMPPSSHSDTAALAALLAASALLLGYVESLIPVVPPVAGIKLGLGNLALLLSLRILDAPRITWGIMLTKVLLCGLLFAGVGTLPYALAGGTASVVVMRLLSRSTRLSCLGVSTAGSIAHMAAQTVVAALLTSTAEVMLLLPVLCFIGILTGTANGLIANQIVRRLALFRP